MVLKDPCIQIYWNKFVQLMLFEIFIYETFHFILPATNNGKLFFGISCGHV